MSSSENRRFGMGYLLTCSKCKSFFFNNRFTLKCRDCIDKAKKKK